MKTLIAYFSRRGNNYAAGSIVNLAVGNTEIAAEKIQALTQGDLFEIQTVHTYSEDYHTCTEEAQRELNENARPKLTGSISDMEEYDTIYLCYPNWWGTMPMAVFTFLESYDFTGKTIHPLCTHEGSGMGRSVEDLNQLCPDAAIGDGLAVQGSHVKKSDKAIQKWINLH